MIPKIAVDIVYDLWPMLALFSIVLITMRVVLLKNQNIDFILYKEIIGLSFILYILLLFELVTSTDFISYNNNFIPFKEIFRYSVFSILFYRNVVGNVLLFIPFGYFTSYYSKVNKYYINLLISFITSVSIELIQLSIGRTFDVDDILLNMAGGYIGYLLYKLTSTLFKRNSTTFKNNIILNVIVIFLILVLLYFILGLYGISLWTNTL